MQAASLSAAAAAVSSPGASQAVPTVADSALPRIALGRRRVTRLIAGYNPVGGFSHATPTLSNYMRSYFTVERTLEFLQHCEALGINTFQFDLSGKTRQVLDRLWAADSDLQFICLHSERAKDASLEDVMNYKAIAVVHHGGVTDSLFRDGKAQQVHDFVKKVHDRGALAGVSTHNPANVARMADEGWENDLFMTCFYNVARTRDEMKQELGLATVGEPFIDTDPDKMTAVIRQVDKPCLAFKILAAGRRCANQKSVSDAFQYAFHNIKTTDAVIVGMFPVDKDEVAENVQLAKQFGAA